MGTLPLGTTGQLLLWQGTGLSLLKSALPKMLSAKVLSLLLHRPLCWSELDAQLSVPYRFLYPKTDVLRRPAGWFHTPHFQLFAWCWRNWSSSIWPGLALCQFCDFYLEMCHPFLFLGRATFNSSYSNISLISFLFITIVCSLPTFPSSETNIFISVSWFLLVFTSIFLIYFISSLGYSLFRLYL